MWKEFKNKFKQMFEEENSESGQPKSRVSKGDQKDYKPRTIQSEVNAKTKMTYKYPKSGEFRFPVIPDLHKSEPVSKPSETQKPRPPRQRETSTSERKSSFSQKPKQNKKPKKEPLPETNSIPFTPTEVPSPIYGYHNRQTKEKKDTEFSKVVEDKIHYSHDEQEWQDFRKRLRGQMGSAKKSNEKKVEIREEAASLEGSAYHKEEVIPASNSSINTSIEDEKETGTNEIEENSLSFLNTHKMDQERLEADSYENSYAAKENEGSGVEAAQPVEFEENEAAPMLEDEEELEVEENEAAPMLEDEEELEVEENEAAPMLEDEEELEAEENEAAPMLEDEEELIVEENKSSTLLAFEEQPDSEEIDGEIELERAEPFTDEEFEPTSALEEQGPSAVAHPKENTGVENETVTIRSEGDSELAVEETSREDLEVSNKTEAHEEKQEFGKKERPKENSKPKRHVPFNVLMTPRDKRTRDQKQLGEKKSGDNNQEAAPKVTSLETKEEIKDERVTYSTPLHLLEDPVVRSDEDETWVREQMELLETTLRHFHVKAKVVNAMKGPTVTRFEVQPEPGVKVSKITNLSDDIKLSMAARDIRIEAPIPGKQAVGIEVPNTQPQMVGLQEIFESQAFKNDVSPLSVGLGLDIGGDSVVTNLKKMPHGLIAGATGSGKSVCINTILVSLLYKAHHEDVKFLLIDPKMVELAPYNDLPHLVSPVITNVKAATTALKWAVKEMEERYEKFVEESVRDVERYNDKMIKQNRASEKLPYLVIVIDELADLMMVSPQDVEDSICRIAQKARACGIHLLVATQRPSVDVITGLIKANIPTRIAFSVSSQVDSRTIIDSGGAEKLLGKGDMLFVENGSGQARRIQGAFVSDDEIERVTGYIKKIAPPQYLFEQDELIKQVSTEEETDELFNEAVQFVVDQNGASASLLQRRFKVGYNRAARLIDQMEEYGIISEQKGSKPRDILLNQKQIEEMTGSGA
ncbi:DNA translocase FtsK [Halobacillus rhizosphaerae]|uniref:DNA translocase FtsK n=1 Tax=Halobacillus rhizosphaerae TaxID=3064889 RepID=UPI00398AD11C